jgi:5,10-methylene-tetrahydrofolate dehydrogenase/methenyl tetrahydrofolate cyclohydrolase
MKWLVRVSGNTKNSKINMEVKYMDDLKLNNIYQKIAHTKILPCTIIGMAEILKKQKKRYLKESP